jgi:hypothetical protein
VCGQRAPVDGLDDDQWIQPKLTQAVSLEEFEAVGDQTGEHFADGGRDGAILAGPWYVARLPAPSFLLVEEDESRAERVQAQRFGVLGRSFAERARCGGCSPARRQGGTAALHFTPMSRPGFVVLLVVAACNGAVDRVPSDAGGSPVGVGPCAVPSNANTMVGGQGCRPALSYPVCTAGRCTDLCTAAEYYLDCSTPLNEPDSAPPVPPAPDPALKCVPQFPNPPNVQTYCCPCGS